MNAVRIALLTVGLLASCSPRGGSEDRTERSPLASAPAVISPDFALGTTVVGATSALEVVAVGAGPTSYLVVTVLTRDFNHRELLATRVLPDGQITDPQGVRLMTDDTPQGDPGFALVERTGDHWLVLWQQSSGSSFSTIVVGDDGLPGAVTSASLTGSLQGISWNGSRALVVSRSGQGLFLDSWGGQLSVAFTISSSPLETESVTFDGSYYVVEAINYGPGVVSVASVGQSGPTGKTTTLYAGGSRSSATTARLESSGQSVVTTYSASPPTCVLGGRCTPMVPYLRVLTTASDGSIVAGVEQQLADPVTLTLVNGAYLLWNLTRTSWLDGNGTPSGGTGPGLAPIGQAFSDAGGSTQFSLVPAGSGAGYLAHDYSHAGRVAADFTLLDQPLLVPVKAPLPQSTPATSFGGNRYLAVWDDSGRNGLAATRVETDGTVLDADPLTIVSGDFHGPFCASSSQSSLVGWFDSRTLGAARVSHDGNVEPIDLSPLSAPYVTSAALASDGSGYLLAYTLPVIDIYPPELRVALVSDAGTVSPSLTLDATNAAVAASFDGENYVTIWPSSNAGMGEMRAARFTPALTALDAPYKALFLYPSSNLDTPPSISSDGARSIVTWTQASDSSIRIARVSRELEVLDPGGVVVTNEAANPRGVVTRWDGARHWVVWQGGLASDERHVQVLARRFAEDLTPLDDGPFVVTEDVHDTAVVPNMAVALAADGAEKLLLTYEQDDEATSSLRVRGRILATETAAAGGGGLGGGGLGGSVGTGGTTETGGMGGIAATGGTAELGGVGGIAATGGTAELGGVGNEGGDGYAGQGATGENAGVSGMPPVGGGGGIAGVAGSAVAGRGGRGGNGAGGTAVSGGRPGAGHGGESLGGEAGGEELSGEAGVGARDGGAGAHAGQAGSSAGSSSGSDGSSGCGCAVPARRADFGPAWVLGVGLVLARRRRARVMSKTIALGYFDGALPLRD